MGSIIEALRLYLKGVGVDLRYIQLTINGVLMGYVALVVLAIFFSSWDLQIVNWGIFAIYTFLCLNLAFSPYVWGVVGLGAYAEGQIGGEPGLDVSDGTDNIKKRAPQALDTILYLTLFAGSIPFLLTALFSTKGHRDVAFGLVAIVPMVIYLAIRAWPKGSLFEDLIRTLVIGLVIAGVLALVYNTFDNATTEPAVQVWQQYQEEQDEAATRARTTEMENIVRKMKRGEKLTPQQEVFVRELGQAAKAGNPVVQNLTGGGGSLKKYVLPALGLVIALLVAMRLMRRSSNVVGTAGTASANTSNGTSRSTGGKLWVFIGEVVLFLTIVWLIGYAIAVANNWNYSETGHIMVRTRENSEVCVNKQFPAGAQLEFVLPGKERGELNVHVQDADGSNRHRTDLASSLFIQGVERGQPFLAPANSSCATVEWRLKSGRELPIDPPVHLNVVIRAKLPHWLEGIANKFR